MPRKIQLRIVGMHCGGCVSSVESALRAVPGVAQAAVQLMTESASVTLAEADLPPARLIAAIRAAGYDAEVTASTAEMLERLTNDRESQETLRRHRQAMVQAVMMALPIIAVDHFKHVLWPHNAASQISANMLELVVLIMLIVSPAGGPILISGLQAALRRRANMDVLISMGVLVAFLSSVYGTFVARDESFVHIHAAAMILGIVCIGRYLEARARIGAASAMKALARRAPKTALLKRDGAFTPIAVEDIALGDLIQAPPGSTIPVDGEVLEGRADIDESLMTGESVPVLRGPGDAVLGGTIVVEGTLLLRATAVGDRSTFGRIVELVARAQTGQTRMQRLADQIAAVFTPIVISIAAVTFAGWIMIGGKEALSSATRAAIAVLVVACPCALGLATPVVTLVASGLAALRGILVRDAGMLEAMGRVDTVVWDKTGTLTSGMLSVRWIRPLSGLSEPDILSIAAGAEQFSTHPIARALEAKARRDAVEFAVPTAFELVPGGGVSATLAGRDVLVGSRAFLESRRIPMFEPASEPSASADARDSVVAVAVDGRAVGLIGLHDTIRPSAAEAVARLRKQGLTVELLTGDAEPVARSVAASVGITTVAARQSPAGKVEHVRRLRAGGRAVAMVGDGVNDAAALAAADVGVAFATGADVASEAAGINLIGSTPHLVADAVELARGAVRIIRQNLFWAFFYNVLMIPLAAAGRLPPSAAAAGMMVSSLTVVLNALRLQRSLGWRSEN